jgi:hypothetical protein
MIRGGQQEAVLAGLRIRLVALKRGGPWATAASYQLDIAQRRASTRAGSGVSFA